MHGLAFYLGVGLAVLGPAYTAAVLYLPGAVFGDQRGPYLKNGAALLILAVSLFGRDLFLLPRLAVYALWLVAGTLALWASREIVVAGQRKGAASPRPARGFPPFRNN